MPEGIMLLAVFLYQLDDLLPFTTLLRGQSVVELLTFGDPGSRLGRNSDKGELISIDGFLQISDTQALGICLPFDVIVFALIFPGAPIHTQGLLANRAVAVPSGTANRNFLHNPGINGVDDRLVGLIAHYVSAGPQVLERSPDLRRSASGIDLCAVDSGNLLVGVP